MIRRKNVEKELQWREILDRQAGSGFSIREFCAREGISQPSFYAWRKKFRERKNDETQGRKPRRRVDGPDNDREFIPLKLCDAASALEVIHPLGYQIRVTGQVNVSALRQVLDVLDGRGDR